MFPEVITAKKVDEIGGKGPGGTLNRTEIHRMRIGPCIILIIDNPAT